MNVGISVSSTHRRIICSPLVVVCGCICAILIVNKCIFCNMNAKCCYKLEMSFQYGWHLFISIQTWFSLCLCHYPLILTPLAVTSTRHGVFLLFLVFYTRVQFLYFALSLSLTLCQPHISWFSCTSVHVTAMLNDIYLILSTYQCRNGRFSFLISF